MKLHIPVEGKTLADIGKELHNIAKQFGGNLAEKATDKPAKSAKPPVEETEDDDLEFGDIGGEEESEDFGEAETAEDTEEEEAPKADLSAIIRALNTYTKKYSHAAAMAILKRFGTDSAPKLKPKHYEAVLAATKLKPGKK